MSNFRNTTKSAAAVMLVLCMLAAVYGCTKDVNVDEGLETLVLTDASGQTKVSYKVVVTATDASGEEYVVTEYYVDDPEEAIEANSRADGTAATTTTTAAGAAGTTKAVGKTTTAPDIPDPTTPATTRSGSGTTAKTTTKAAATTASSTTGKATTAAGATTATTRAVTTTKVTTTKVTTTAEPTTYVPVSEISAAFTYLNETDQASYFATSSTLSNFGLSDTKEAALKKAPSEWGTYTIAVDFKNTTGSNITVYGLKLTDNGARSVYIAPNSAGVVGYTANDKSTQRLYFNVLVGNSSLSEAAIIATIRSMGASLVYSRTPGSDNDAVQKQYSEIV